MSDTIWLDCYACWKFTYVVSAAGAQYATVIRMETREIKARGDDVTADELIKTMQEE